MRGPALIARYLLSGLLLMGSVLTQAQTPPPLLARPPQVAADITETLTPEKLRKFAISVPAPEYPLEARRRHLSGMGVFELEISDAGEVSSVTTIRSTGHPILDRAAVKTLKLWRFRPHIFSRVKVPMTFSMTKKPNQTTKQT